MPKRRNALILRRLQYFEATARLGSAKLAADELGVSPSAISHQLSDLKRTIGENLFERTAQGLELTSAGRQLAQRLSMAFRILDTSVAQAIGSERHVVRIAACSSFGPYWLAPRLPEFRAAHSDFDVELRLYGQDPELTQASADCIITAQAVKPGFVSVDLFPENSFPIAAPEALKKGRPTDLPLITTNTEIHKLGSDWRSFFEATGESWARPDEAEWLRCSHYILAFEMAKAGMGAALIPDFVSAHSIRDRQLERIGTASFNHEDRFYRVCVKEEHSSDPDIQATVTWLRRAARIERYESGAVK